MSNYMGFSSDQVNVFILVVDSSGSMENNESNVKKGLELYKKSFENFPEIDSIAVSVCRFADTFNEDDFKQVSEMNTKYSANGATALYYSIVRGKEHLDKYIQQIIENKGVIPRATFILLSDGEPCNDQASRSEAKAAIESLNYSDVTTVFVAFGKAIEAKFGDDLGFVATIDVNDKAEALTQFLGVELSKSCKEQSQSMKALGSSFFSHAADKSSSASFSKTTKEVLGETEDDDWMNSI